MNRYFSIIKADYTQRFRSYNFVITLLVSVIVAYKFVPLPEDNYTTLRVNNFVGFSNTAWIGHSTAMMTSLFLWLIGFYLINNGLKRDRETGVGQIIATTSITNFQYLVSKAFSNFLVLSTIAGIIFLMSFVLVLVRGSHYEFDVIQFVIPYLLSTLPSLFFLSAFTVLFEVLFGKRSNLMNVLFFFVFAIILFISNAPSNSQTHWIDPLGIKYLANEILSSVEIQVPEENLLVGMGINYNVNDNVRYFLFEGSTFRLSYFVARISWIILAFIILKLSAILFNRFEAKPIIRRKYSKVSKKSIIPKKQVEALKMETLMKSETNFGIFPLIKAEFIMLLRKGATWFWLVNIGIFIALFLIPLDIALNIMLPIFLFFQVNRWADIATKEQFFGTDTFIYSTYKPLKRLLISQIISAIILAEILVLPLILRLLVEMQFLESVQVVLGAVVLVSFAVCSGIVWSGKRFFEISFFLLTYAIISEADFLNYMGGYFPNKIYIIFQLLISIFFLIISFLVRNQKIKRL